MSPTPCIFLFCYPLILSSLENIFSQKCSVLFLILYSKFQSKRKNKLNKIPEHETPTTMLDNSETAVQGEKKHSLEKIIKFDFFFWVIQPTFGTLPFSVKQLPRSIKRRATLCVCSSKILLLPYRNSKQHSDHSLKKKIRSHEATKNFLNFIWTNHDAAESVFFKCDF